MSTGPVASYRRPMPPGAAARPPARPSRPRVGAWVAGGVGALTVVFATVLTAEPAAHRTAGVEATAGTREATATDAATPADAASSTAETASASAPVDAAAPVEQPDTRVVELDVTMVPFGSASGEAATPDVAPAPLTPTAALGCPLESVLAGTLAEATFGYGITPGSAPIVRYAIDYGDGGSFASDTVDGVFSHTYALGGTYEIDLEVTDADGHTATASCSWTFSLLDPLR
jgi:hypothetical protein